MVYSVSSGTALGALRAWRSKSKPSRTRPSRRGMRPLRFEPLEARNLPDGTTLLIGTWNIGIADAGYRLGSYGTVLGAMGNESNYANPQPPDVLTVAETRSNARTGSTADTEFLTQIMNDVYGGGYDHGTLNGYSTGAGTQGVIFNTQTVQLLEERTVGFASSNGPARQELRYLFRPAGYDDGSADFYIYVGHYKAGFTSTDLNRRNVEAQQVRADADALGPGVHVLYTGDFNADSSNEPAEQTLMASGNGQAFDPIGRLGQWYNNGAMIDIMSEAPAVNAPPGLIGGGLKNRYDLLWETAPVIGDVGLQAIPSTYHSLGNNGSVPLHQSIDYPGNTALPELDNRLDVLNALAHDSSDHMPVLQDYQIITPSSGRGRGTGGVFAVPPLPASGTGAPLANFSPEQAHSLRGDAVAAHSGDGAESVYSVPPDDAAGASTRILCEGVSGKPEEAAPLGASPPD